jgi:uncharacterized protein YdiU (UPF0061 family)
MSLILPFDNTYASLPDRFFSRLDPTPVSTPGAMFVNDALAVELGLDPQELRGPDGIAMFAGNIVPGGAAPLAQAYAGHQFGGFNPQLGDGRAVLLGEITDINGVRHDIQLKGSGPTPFSRMGDGRAWVGPVLREYIMSEAMHALGIPTTRALAAVTTGDTVLREAAFPGAVLTRVAQSHVRVGTFQYFAARKDIDALETLTQYVLARHYPDADGALGLLQAAVKRQATLIAKWMSVGFVHGVMNTDNCQIAGETIDYGPCAFMDIYHPNTVFSSIDQHGRYAFNRQPDIAMWNLAQLATSLLPLIDPDTDAAVAAATEVIHSFTDHFQPEWVGLFRAKIGLITVEDGDEDLISDLLARMAGGRADFTNTFRALSGDKARDQFLNPDAFDQWEPAYRARLARESGDTPHDMDQINPAVIPRTHRIEEAIQAAVTGNLEPAKTLIAALSTPFDLPSARHLTRPPEPDEIVPQTFCGT